MVDIFLQTDSSLYYDKPWRTRLNFRVTIPKLRQLLIRKQDKQHASFTICMFNDFSRLLEDYSSFVIPNSLAANLCGHRNNVKCVEFLGEEGREIVSGSR